MDSQREVELLHEHIIDHRESGERKRDYETDYRDEKPVTLKGILWVLLMIGMLGALIYVVGWMGPRCRLDRIIQGIGRCSDTRVRNPLPCSLWRGHLSSREPPQVFMSHYLSFFACHKKGFRW